MYKFLLRALFFIGFISSSIFAFCQDSLKTEKPEMADLMRSNGKIYVVVAVFLVILAGLFLYVINLDRKISRMEKIK